MGALAYAQPALSAPGQATSLIFAFPGGKRSQLCATGELPAKPDGSKWPPGKVQQLTQLWEMGLSHGSIAVVMGLSKGAVSAKLDRLNLERAKPIVDGRSFAVQAPRPAAQTFADHPGRMVTLLELTGCKAPTAYRDYEHLFCDEPRSPGKPYCACHQAMATRKATP